MLKRYTGEQIDTLIEVMESLLPTQVVLQLPFNQQTRRNPAREASTLSEQVMLQRYRDYAEGLFQEMIEGGLVEEMFTKVDKWTVS
jgi:hypothetical protein